MPLIRRPRSDVTTANGIVTITGELEEDSAIRELLAAHSPDKADRACARARAAVKNLEGRGRPGRR
ncbi:hypothetical protein FXW78_49880 [Rhodococcus opacus]|nr:hypothetical protein [Rhodococcus opacus]